MACLNSFLLYTFCFVRPSCLLAFSSSSSSSSSLSLSLSLSLSVCLFLSSSRSAPIHFYLCFPLVTLSVLVGEVPHRLPMRSLPPTPSQLINLHDRAVWWNTKSCEIIAAQYIERLRVWGFYFVVASFIPFDRDSCKILRDCMRCTACAVIYRYIHRPFTLAIVSSKCIYLYIYANIYTSGYGISLHR